MYGRPHRYILRGEPGRVLFGDRPKLPVTEESGHFCDHGAATAVPDQVDGKFRQRPAPEFWDEGGGKERWNCRIRDVLRGSEGISGT